jgi:hypothetical protein
MMSVKRKLKSATITWFPAAFVKSERRIFFKEIYPEGFSLNNNINNSKEKRNENN